MMFISAKHVTKIIGYTFSGLVLFTGGVLAQTEPEVARAPIEAPPTAVQPETAQAELPETGRPQTGRPQTSGRTGFSFQPGAGYQTPDGPKTPGSKIERAKLYEQNLRKMMAAFGVTELDVQNAIVVYVQEEIQRRQPLREQGLKLYKALKDPAISTTDLATVLTDYRAVVEADKVRRDADEAALDAQTGYTANPRLEAMLLLFGVIGDGPTIMTVPSPSPVPKPIAPRTVDASSTASSSKGATPGTDNESPQSINDASNFGFSEAQRLALLEHFDFNHDGELDAAERTEARENLAREYLARGLWPRILPKSDAAGNNNGTGNAGASNGNADSVSTPSRNIPEAPPVSRIPGPLPVIPANAVTEPGPPPAN